MKRLFAKALGLVSKAVPFVTAWWKFALVLISASLLSYQAGSCTGYGRGKAAVQQQLDRANLAAAAAQHQADELASLQRVTDSVAVSRHEQETINAIRQGPDTAPDPAALRLACQRLHDADPVSPPVPACR